MLHKASALNSQWSVISHLSTLVLPSCRIFLTLAFRSNRIADCSISVKGIYICVVRIRKIRPLQFVYFNAKVMAGALICLDSR
jgi:hypothetical protein